MSSWPTGIETVKSLLAANSLQNVAHRGKPRTQPWMRPRSILTVRKFTKPPPRDAFRSFGRLRRSRNQIEYDDISPTTADDVRADEPVVRALHTMADQLVDVLPVFID